MPVRPSIRKDFHAPVFDARRRRCHLRCVVARPPAHVLARPAAPVRHVWCHRSGSRAYRSFRFGNAFVCWPGHAAFSLPVAWQGTGLPGLVVCLHRGLCGDCTQRRDGAFTLRLLGCCLRRPALSGAGGAVPRIWCQARHALLSAGGDWSHRHFHRLDSGELCHCQLPDQLARCRHCCRRYRDLQHLGSRHGQDRADPTGRCGELCRCGSTGRS